MHVLEVSGNFFFLISFAHDLSTLEVENTFFVSRFEASIRGSLCSAARVVGEGWGGGGAVAYGLLLCFP